MGQTESAAGQDLDRLRPNSRRLNIYGRKTKTRKEQERRWWCHGFYYGKVDEGEKGCWVCITGKQGSKVLSAESCWEHVAKS